MPAVCCAARRRVRAAAGGGKRELPGDLDGDQGDLHDDARERSRQGTERGEGAQAAPGPRLVARLAVRAIRRGHRHAYAASAGVRRAARLPARAWPQRLQLARRATHPAEAHIK